MGVIDWLRTGIDMIGHYGSVRKGLLGAVGAVLRPAARWAVKRYQLWGHDPEQMLQPLVRSPKTTEAMDARQHAFDREVYA